MKNEFLGVQLLQMNFEVSGLTFLVILLVFLVLLVLFAFSLSAKSKKMLELEKQRNFAVKEKALLEYNLSQADNQLEVANTDLIRKANVIQKQAGEIVYLKSIVYEKYDKLFTEYGLLKKKEENP